MAMRALITGVAGFTGWYLAPELAAAGYEVVGLVMEAGAKPQPGVSRCVAGDLRDPARLREIVEEVRPHVVAHLAGISFVPHGNVDEIYATNLVGPRHLLDALAGLDEKPRMTLVASSANVYGNVDVEHLDEGTPPAPANDYAVAKLAMEYVARMYADRLPVVTTRPFNYTGVGQSPNFLLPKIVQHVRDRAPVIELGNLDVARDFQDVRDVVRIYAQLLERADVAGATLNVCSGQAFTLRQVLRMAEEISGHHLEVTVNPAFVRPNEVKVLKGSRKLLDHYADGMRIPLRDTLRWMIEASG